MSVSPSLSLENLLPVEGSKQTGLQRVFKCSGCTTTTTAIIIIIIITGPQSAFFSNESHACIRYKQTWAGFYMGRLRHGLVTTWVGYYMGRLLHVQVTTWAGYYIGRLLHG